MIKITLNRFLFSAGKFLNQLEATTIAQSCAPAECPQRDIDLEKSNSVYSKE